MHNNVSMYNMIMCVFTRLNSISYILVFIHLPYSEVYVDIGQSVATLEYFAIF